MKTTMLMALMVALMALTACETDVKTETAAVDHAGAIAGDKAMTADVMHKSFEKGTFDDALTLAMQDSALAREVAEIVRQHPGLLAGTAQSTTGTAASRASSSRAATTVRSSTTAKKGDVLDQTENKAREVNQKLDQAARIKKEAEEAKKKVDDIFKK